MSSWRSAKISPGRSAASPIARIAPCRIRPERSARLARAQRWRRWYCSSVTIATRVVLERLPQELADIAAEFQPGRQHADDDDLIDAIAADSGLSKADAARAVESAVTTVTKSLKKGDEVVITGRQASRAPGPEHTRRRAR